MALTIHSLLATLRRATPHQLSAFRNALGIMIPEEMDAHVGLPDLSASAATSSRPSYTDFFTTSTKAGNDAANKRRETFLTTLYDMELAADAPAQLRQLHTAWRTTLQSLCPSDTESATVRVSAAGGRNKNYDFQLDYLTADGTIAHSQKAEFKHGAATIEAQPQFLSLAAKDLRFPVSYAEFYYDNFLTRYCETDTSIIAPPDRETYLKAVHSANYDAHPFFRCLYDREETAKKAKAAVVNESIRAYLAAYADKCDLTHLAALMTAKQNGKAFLMWDMTKFHVGYLTAADLTPTEFRGVRNGNTILLATATKTLKLLLRWKNHKGVLYPAWQIGLAAL